MRHCSCSGISRRIKHTNEILEGPPILAVLVMIMYFLKNDPLPETGTSWRSWRPSRKSANEIEPPRNSSSRVLKPEGDGLSPLIGADWKVAFRKTG